MQSMLSAVIPACNEAERIGGVVTGALEYVDEVVVVDDGSSDATAKAARAAGASVVSFAKNRGYIQAIKAGFRETSGEVVVTLDADGEFPTEYIPLLVAPVLSGEADMAQGHRDSIPRPSERFLTWLASLKRDVGDSGTGLRAISSKMAKSLEIRGACICGVLSLEVLQRGGRIVEVPIKLNAVDKPRKIAWFHVRQIFYLVPWFWARI